jgi:hypothetical protein
MEGFLLSPAIGSKDLNDPGCLRRLSWLGMSFGFFPRTNRDPFTSRSQRMKGGLSGPPALKGRTMFNIVRKMARSCSGILMMPMGGDSGDVK